MNLDGVIVTMKDIRASKLCSSGTRIFLEKHGFLWRDFLINGISATKLAATNDAMALKVVEVACGRPQ